MLMSGWIRFRENCGSEWQGFGLHSEFKISAWLLFWYWLLFCKELDLTSHTFAAKAGDVIRSSNAKCQVGTATWKSRCHLWSCPSLGCNWYISHRNSYLCRCPRMFFSINKESHQPIGSMIIVDDFPPWFVFLEMCLVQIFMPQLPTSDLMLNIHCSTSIFGNVSRSDFHATIAGFSSHTEMTLLYKYSWEIVILTWAFLLCVQICHKQVWTIFWSPQYRICWKMLRPSIQHTKKHWKGSWRNGVVCELRMLSARLLAPLWGASLVKVGIWGTRVTWAGPIQGTFLLLRYQLPQFHNLCHPKRREDWNGWCVWISWGALDFFAVQCLTTPAHYWTVSRSFDWKCMV